VRSTALAAFLVLSALPLGPASSGAAAPPSPRVRVELLSEVDAVVPGRTFWIGLSQRIEPGWHTYWINPGDSGEPTGIEWQAPAGFSVGDIAWPHPERIRVGPAMSFGYSDRVVLPIPVTAPADIARGSRATLRGQAHWLVCEKTCIPEEASVELSLPVADRAAPDARGAEAIQRAATSPRRRRGPRPSAPPRSASRSRSPRAGSRPSASPTPGSIRCAGG